MKPIKSEQDLIETVRRIAGPKVLVTLEGGFSLPEKVGSFPDKTSEQSLDDLARQVSFDKTP